LSDFCKSYCREIDRVTVKGSAKAMHIFTVDVDTSEFAVVPKSTVSAEKLSKIHED